VSMSQWLDEDRHAELCGTEAGYQQISRARRSAKDAGAAESDWPTYDTACKDAWSAYIKRQRKSRGQGTGPRKPVDHPHGTKERYRQETYLRHKQRRAGVPEDQLPEICDDCRRANRDAKLVDELDQMLGVV